MALVVEPKESLFTTSRGFTNYRGILNLFVILLVLSNARAALENIIKYGILVDPISWFAFLIDSPRHWPSVGICLFTNVTIISALLIEKLFIMNYTIVAYILMSINLFKLIALPPIVIYTCETHPVTASAALMLVSIVFLKLVSYHMINYWCRDVKHPEDKQASSTRAFLKVYKSPRELFRQVSHDTDEPAKKLDPTAAYPSNLTLSDIYYFMVAPTLCYELEFARTTRIRKHFLFKRTIELVILLQLDLALIQQWIVPTVSNSLVPLLHMRFTHMLERLLKLAIPNHVIWIIWFYLFFHSLLNIVAELTRFADREFYHDWWNSESVYYFWSNWNIPVHKWCARHLYVPLLAMGCPRWQASTAVFFVSAFFHEYLVSVPLKLFRCWAFLGMLSQLPLARFVSTYFNKQYANVAVWITLIIGQPLCILMYYHDYYIINNA